MKTASNKNYEVWNKSLNSTLNATIVEIDERRRKGEIHHSSHDDTWRVIFDVCTDSLIPLGPFTAASRALDDIAVNFHLPPIYGETK
jgi:hypothetical protein